MGQQIDTIFGVTGHREIGADIVQQEGWEDGDGRITSVAEVTELVEGRLPIHVVAQVGTQGVVEVLPAMAVGQELVTVLDSQEEWAIEFLIVAAVAALYAAVVPFAALGVASKLSIQGAEELLGQLTHALWVVAAKLLPPVGLEGDRGVAAERSEPHQDEHNERQAIGAIEAMAVSQKPEPGAASTRRPLVAREALAAQMGSSPGAQSSFVQDIFGICLDE
ncbi:MAG: hypothetical protein PVJ55_07140 [Anaerolineae bacterium]